MKCTRLQFHTILRGNSKSIKSLNIYIIIIRSVIENACQVWHTSLTKKQKTSSKAYRKGPCVLHFVECAVATPSPLQNNQRCQTGGRRFAYRRSRACSNPITSCSTLLPPPGHVITQSVMHVFTVFLAVGQNVLRTPLSYTDCPIGNN